MFLDSNGYVAHAEAHHTYLHGKSQIPCMSRRVEDQYYYCEYVKKHNGCLEIVTYFNYLELFACQIELGDKMNYVEDILVVLIAIIFLLAYSFPLYLITRFFELPNIITIRNHLHISDYSFGTTFLTFVMALQLSATFSNRCASIYSSPILIAQIYGFVMLALCLGVGILCLRSPFILNKSFVLYDIIFVTIGITYFSELVFEAEVNTNNLTIILFIYFFYLSGLVIRGLYSFKNLPKTPEGLSVVTEPHWVKLKVLEKRSTSHVYNYSTIPSCLMSMLHEWWLILTEYCAKWLIFITIPIWVILAIALPVVDRNRIKRGWNKYTDCLSIIILPTLIYINSPSKLLLLFSMPFLFICFILYLVTRQDEEPTYHLIFAYLSLGSAGCLLSMIVEEMQTLLLQASFYLRDWKAETIYLSVSAFTGSVPVIAMIWNLSTYGYNEIAWGLLYGLIMYRIFITWAVFLYQQCHSSKKPFLDIRIGSESVTAAMFLYIAIIFQVVSFAMTGLVIRRSHGFFLIMLYIIYSIFTFLGQFEIIHPYGTGHSLTGYALDDDYTLVEEC